MGFDDRAIVALSGGHNLGRCHKDRSGYDGPWTTKPLVFDNEYYIVRIFELYDCRLHLFPSIQNLLNKEWVEKKWDGPLQYEDKETGKLLMLPTDIVLIKVLIGTTFVVFSKKMRLFLRMKNSSRLSRSMPRTKMPFSSKY